MDDVRRPRLASSMRRPTAAIAALLFVGILWHESVAGDAPAESLLPRASPESVGLSTAALGRLDRVLEAQVASGERPGFVVLVARKGKIAHFEAFGFADVERRRPMRPDSLFRIYSMTKPVTSAALLTLYEEGRLQLTDPLEVHLPAFANLRVLAGTGADGEMQLAPPARKVTVQDVFRHTAGFSYGIFSDTPVDLSYRKAGVSYDNAGSLAELVDKLAAQPLLYEPGTQWHYSFAHDVQARLVEVLSGKPFDEFLRERIFEPLGMRDSTFHATSAADPRYTKLHGPGVGQLGGDATSTPFGGIGLTMSAADYWRFAQMLANGGTLDGVRILSRKTVELMTSDHLPPGTPGGPPGRGYGLGVYVLTSPAAYGNLGTAGQFGWSGAASTYAIIDPGEELVGLLFTQYMPMDFAMQNQFTTLLLQTVAD